MVVDYFYTFSSLVGKHDGMGVVLSPWVRQYTAGRFGLSTTGTYTGFKSLSRLFRNTEFLGVQNLQ